ncbi:MAG: LysM peptidoglycan-binding domain-containing protein [Firmicutes bacterium]|nr:LysM peptidoglycan-binding domain-containing protein [Bacillota bacterium]
MKRPNLRLFFVTLGLVIALLSGTSFGAEYDIHVVQKGDTLYSLAKSRGVSVDELMAINGLSGPEIRIGDLLKLPRNNEQATGQVRSGVELPVLTASIVAAIPQLSTEYRPTLETPKTETIRVEPPKVEAPKLEAPKTGNERPQSTFRLTAEEYDLLTRLVYAESRGEPFEGQVAVAAVVLNRVKHPSFPNTVKEVIMEPGQFLSVDNGMILLTPGEEARRAVDMALAGHDPSRGALFFYNPRKSKALAWWQTRTTTAVIGDHNFAI